MTLAAMQDGKHITTIEGLERDGTLHPIQAAFIEHDGFQCGFCTSGQIMSAVAMIEEAKAGWPSAATTDVGRPFNIADLSAAEVREGMAGNLCRCACYPNIVDAVAHAGGRSWAMHPVALASADDPATAIAAHADDPELALIVGGPDLIGLMKDRAALPIEALPEGGCIQPPPAMAATAYDKEQVYESL